MIHKILAKGISPCYDNLSVDGYQQHRRAIKAEFTFFSFYVELDLHFLVLLAILKQIYHNKFCTFLDSISEQAFAPYHHVR